MTNLPTVIGMCVKNVAKPRAKLGERKSQYWVEGSWRGKVTNS